MTSLPPPESQVSLHTHPEVPDGIVPAERPDPPGSLAAVPVWAPLAAMLVAFIAAAIAFALIAAGIEAGGGTVTDDGPPGLVISATLVQDAALIVAAALFAGIWAHGLTPASFGLRSTRLGPAFGWTLLAWVAFVLFSQIYVQLLGQPEDQALTEDLRNEETLSALVGYGVLLAVVAPLAEEIFFRGFVFGVLREKIGVIGGGLASAVVFGIVHATGSPIETVGVLIILGVLLCALYVKTGSLLPCIALHALNNGLSFALTTEVPAAGGILLVVGCVAASVGVSVAVMRRVPALPGVQRTPR